MTPDFVWSLDTHHLGQRVHLYNCLNSTNTLALSLGRDLSQHGLVLLARTQTAGRGQYGRSWQAPPDSSVLMSVLLFLPPALRRPALLTAWGAVSVCETIRRLTSLRAAIKWPNDVLIEGKKVCGILIEQGTTGDAEFPLATALGIGLNLTQSAEFFEQASLPLAASLRSLSGLTLANAEVAQQLIHELDRQYQRLLQADYPALEAAWKDRLGLLGKPVVASGATQRHQGRLLDVTLEAVLLEMPSGEIIHLAPESIRQLEPAPSA